LLTLNCTEYGLSGSEHAICHDTASTKNSNHSDGQFESALVLQSGPDRSIDSSDIGCEISVQTLAGFPWLPVFDLSIPSEEGVECECYKEPQILGLLAISQ
jgi:hypothetical protein